MFEIYKKGSKVLNVFFWHTPRTQFVKLTNCVPGRTTWRWYAVAALSERLQDAHPKAPPRRSHERLQGAPPWLMFFVLSRTYKERGAVPSSLFSKPGPGGSCNASCSGAHPPRALHRPPCHTPTAVGVSTGTYCPSLNSQLRVEAEQPCARHSGQHPPASGRLKPPTRWRLPAGSQR